LKTIKLITTAFLSFIILSGLFAQDAESFRIVFYNVENYFDAVDDSLTRDEEFTPEGTRYWSWYKYNEKAAKIYKAIAAFSQWKKPDIIGLCELENRNTLENLLKRTPFGDSDYRIVHQESEDFRGIDVGLLYNPESVWPISENYIKVRFEGSPNKRTRDILHLKALLKNKDTLHVFVNHWPSKYGGAVATIPLRATAARALRHVTDSILRVNANANIVITGDFNDTPEDVSLREHLMALPLSEADEGQLINLTGSVSDTDYSGTHKYQGQWSFIDQFIVSPAMLRPDNPVYTNVEKLDIGNIDMLMEPDEKYTGQRPYRTFIGFKYHGGFSDHLPVLLDLELR
jgi:predicted extracellular nuclease